jgi:hypothetical protein
MRRFLLAVLVLGAVAAASWTPGAGSEYGSDYYPAEEYESIDVAICLDTSQSMQKLIDAARIKLWEIVNDLALAEPMPRLRVALITYGARPRTEDDGWVRVHTPLTEDLDLVSQRLFELKTSGDKEYLGRVLAVALDELEWTESEESLRLLFIAGNERADQDMEVDFREMSRDAARRGIAVNAIFCGKPARAISGGWEEMARLGGGQFASIDLRRELTKMSTPYDEELAKLSGDLNRTFVPLGDRGRTGQENQALQDKNARSMSLAVAASRAEAKSSPLYSASWDLLSALESGRLTLEEVDESELPEEMQAMSLDERQRYLEELLLEREELRQQILRLSAQRREQLIREGAAGADADARSFDRAVRRAIRQQARKKGFEFPDE